MNNLCGSFCPHLHSVNTDKRPQVIVNGEKCETHPCHKYMDSVCIGSLIESEQMRPLNGDTVNFTHSQKMYEDKG